MSYDVIYKLLTVVFSSFRKKKTCKSSTQIRQKRDNTHDASVSTPRCVQLISARICSSSCLSRDTRFRAKATSDLSRSGSYLVLTLLELEHTKMHKKSNFTLDSVRKWSNPCQMNSFSIPKWIHVCYKYDILKPKNIFLIYISLL